MKKYISIALLFSGALFASSEVRLSAGLEKEWFDYKAHKYALSAEEFEDMAQLAQNDCLKDDFKDIAEDLEELSDKMKDVNLPEQGVLISLSRKAQWDSLKAKGQALRERKAAEIKQFQAKKAVKVKEPSVVMLEEIQEG